MSTRLLAAVALALALLPAFAVGASADGSAKALILCSTVIPTDCSSPSLEQQAAEADGFSVDTVGDRQWLAMSASDFANYQVLIIGDPSCGDTVDGAAGENTSTWEPVVMANRGNRVVIGTDPVFHDPSHPGALTLIKNGIAFAGAVPGATGAYIDISCDSSYTSNGSPFAFLDGLTTKGPGHFLTEAPPCESAIAIVAQSGPTSGLHDSDLSNWDCSVHQSFKSWATDWTPLAIATDAPERPYCADDVDTGALVCGEPYILVAGKGIVVKSEISLDPATASNPVGTSHTVTATVTQDGRPLAGAKVDFAVDDGPDAGLTGSGTTNDSGQTSFTYTNNGTAGTDEISAQFVNANGQTERATATKDWVAPPETISLAPATASNPVGTSHTVTATVTQGERPLPGRHVDFAVDSGPDAGLTGSGTTDGNGQASFTYTNNGTPGTDGISATFVDDAGQTQRATATKDWVVPEISLTVTAAADSATAAPGAADGYTVSIQNGSSAPARVNSIVDTLPNGFAYVKGSTTGDITKDPAIAGHELTWNGPFTIAGGARLRFHFSVHVANTPGVYLDNVTARTDGGDFSSGPTAKITVARTPSADLSLTKSASPGTVVVGAQVTFSLRVDNAGPDMATGVSLSDDLPDGLSFVSASSSPSHSCDSGGCFLDRIPAGNGVTVTITAKATKTGTLSNSARVSSDVADPDTSNNGAGATVTVVANTADLSVTQTVSPAIAPTGGTVTFRVTVHNAGPGPATNVVLTEPLPTGISATSATASQGTCDLTVRCSLGTLAAGADATVTIVATLGAPGQFSATASASSDVSDPAASNNAGAASATASAPPPSTKTTGDVDSGTVRVNGRPYRSGPIPYGATVDVTHGTLGITNDLGTLHVNGAGGIPAIFKLLRGTDTSKFSTLGKKRSQPVTELRLVGGSFAACKPGKKKAARLPASRGATKPPPKPVRRLFAKGTGHFRTRGAYAAGTIRGTSWIITDRCDGTLVTVRTGTVQVTDLVKHRVILVHTGHSYLARAPKK